MSGIPATRVIAILGMHRSGTSCLAGTLQAAGLHLGDVFTQNPHNRKGNREHPDIMALHEAVLTDNRARWDQPPEGPLRWSPAFAARRREIIEKFDGQAFWGFKDPRTLLGLDGWRQSLPNLKLAGIFRHPEAVAASLMARSPRLFERDSALALWRAYNRRLLNEYRKRAFPVVEFVSDADGLADRLAAVCSALELPERSRAGAFLDPGLQKQRPADTGLDEESATLYARLRACEREFEPSFS